MIEQMLSSWSNFGQALHSIDEILAWIEERKNSVQVHITPCRLPDGGFWFYDQNEGAITNRSRSFFSIRGISSRKPEETACEQPIIVQDEIGFLGLLCKEIQGTLYFLMQAKIEPGNINMVQLSPTLQATRSNFTQKHGGGVPPYLEYFLHAENEQIIVDQLQSEQSSRFYKKRNRNIIILTQKNVDVLPSHQWMTLGQIKHLMRYDNLVNMDTRTVLSCIPFPFMGDKHGAAHRFFNDQSLYHSIFDAIDSQELVKMLHFINSYKMLVPTDLRFIRLDELQDWKMDDFGIRCQDPYSFSVIYCGIEMEGREVRRWTQPLLKAEGIATFGLYSSVVGGKRKFLVRALPETGCFDKIEFGPTVQMEAVSIRTKNDVDLMFLAQYARKERVICDVLLSEEGGRFYHEQNRNIILETDFFDPPDGYFWADYRTLGLLIQFNNYVNIQLRNLMALLEV